MKSTYTKNQELIDIESKYSAHNYHPLPVVLERGQGVSVWDVEGNHYYDFLSGYSAVNQGHCHPKIVETMIQQAQKLTLTSRAFHSDMFPKYAEYICGLFKYDKVLPMNSGVEAVETALKLARKWGYESKGVPKDEAIIITAQENFHGRTINVISFSTDDQARNNFGPFNPGYVSVPYNNIDAIAAIITNKNVVALLLEPIQGEAGVIVPEEGYLSKAYQLCQDNNVLFIADEIQTGLARTGKMLAVDHENIHPDILILGKALSGGTMPISAVLADDKVMSHIHPGEHGSTYGGNPLACAVAMTALEVLQTEGMIENAAVQGAYFRKTIEDLNNDHIRLVRGKGLLNAIEIQHTKNDAAWDLCIEMKNLGLLAKPTHGDKIRLAPPLVINQEQIDQSVDIIKKALKSL